MATYHTFPAYPSVPAQELGNHSLVQRFSNWVLQPIPGAMKLVHWN